ncbi:DEAD/DEAH box helicase [Alteromonas pelagimontana]|uniref:DEAD/DEAH box helicase n=1 Tax=Alteromonas pelagimontana TaxID=1858656 RepID=A0A6M4MG53_9ALTE|nr:DEAD/DEAH box helicase [Alteromonas pelagimontana]QJR82164.1 DEAD/DEAH box helicase [Alteromonas pelagimontana]
MTDSADFYWSYDNQVFHFFAEGASQRLHPKEWGRFQLQRDEKAICADPLFRLANSSADIEVSDKGIFCSSATIAELTEIEVKQLGLLNVFDGSVKLSTSGLISSPNFQISYRLLNAQGRPVLGAKVNDIFVKAAGKESLLLDPLFQLTKRIDRFNNTSFDDRDEQFVALGEIKELLPEEAVVDGQLDDITICRADRLTLDVQEHGVFNPLLIKPAAESEWNTQSQSDVEYAVPKVRQKQFEDHFKSWSGVRSNYAVGNNTYVVLPKRIQDVLTVVKDYQTRPAEERLAFVSNPHKVINEALGLDETPEDTEAVFVETPEFVSQRIANIGVWEPKLCAYVVKREGDWVPDDSLRLFFPIEDLLVNFTVEEMKHLLEAVTEALDNEITETTFSGQQVPVSLETKNLLIRMLKPFDDDGPADPYNPKEVLAPVLKDNIEEIDFEIVKRSARPALNRMPEKLKTKTLYDHQKFGVNWLCEHWESGSVGALLADDMGLGKTLQTLAFLTSVKSQMDSKQYTKKPFLVVAPSGLLKNWLDEARIHIQNDGVGEVFEAFGENIRALKTMSVVERNRLLSRSDWILTTYETLRDKIKYFISIDWGVTVFDEAQKIKNPVSRVTEMAKSLSSDFTLMLTGTPVENELKDLWCIVDTAQPGLFGSLSHFHNEYALPAESDPTEAKRLKSLLVDKSHPALMLRRMKEEHISGLPEKVIREVPIEMPALQADEYEKIIKDGQDEAAKGGMLGVIQKIRRASLVAEEFDGSGITDGVIKRSARLSALIKILDDIHSKGEKALIFCEAIDVQEYLSGYLQQRYQLPTRPFRINGSVDGYTRKRFVDEFQQVSEGEFDIMLLSPKAGGVGLTITAANHVIHLTRWWNPAVEDQSTDRAFRIGQKKTVHVYIPLALHPKYKEQSFDANLNRLLTNKRNLSMNALLPGTLSKEEMHNLFSDTLNTKN